jgi:integrase
MSTTYAKRSAWPLD